MRDSAGSDSLRRCPNTGKDLNGVAGRDGKKHPYVAGGDYALSTRTELNIAALNRNPSASSTGGMSLGMRRLF